MAAALVRTKVELFYDVVSPYTWLAFETLCRYRPYWRMELVLRPFYLGGVMNATGNRPPMMVPAKGMYMGQDLKRNAAYFQVPIKMMEDPYHAIAEKGSLKAQRFLTAVDVQYPKYLEEASRQLWMRIWARDEDIVEDTSIQQAARKAGMDDSVIKECLKMTANTNIKNILKEATEEAIEYGAFGAPTIVAHTQSGPEMVFGADRFPILAILLNEEWKGPVPGTSSKL